MLFGFEVGNRYVLNGGNAFNVKLIDMSNCIVFFILFLFVVG